MLKKYLLILSILASTSLTTKSQEHETKKAEEAFKPHGKVIARGFLDYSAGLGRANEKSGFDIKRALLGYNYQITPSLRAQLVIDGAAGKSSSGNYEVALRNAFIEWSDYGFIISAGQIGLTQFSLQENYWQHRYIEKSLQDLTGMSPSVDLGVSAEYKFNDIISADISLTNGEGYRKISKNNSNRYSLGVNFHFIDNFVFRGFASTYTNSEDIQETAPEGIKVSRRNENTLGAFIGYQNKLLSAGVEYNYLFNKGFIKGQDFFGYSVYTSYNFKEKWNVFARFDSTDSDTPSNFTYNWSINDKNSFIGGVEFRPVKQLKIAPNIRFINPTYEKSNTYLFVNMEFNL